MSLQTMSPHDEEAYTQGKKDGSTPGNVYQIQRYSGSARRAYDKGFDEGVDFLIDNPSHRTS